MELDSDEHRADFLELIEGYVRDMSLSYIDAIVHHCDTTGLEIETVVRLMSPPLVAKIEDEAIALRYLPKESRLPL